MPFLSHTGLEPFDNALALNVTYERVKYLRPKIERATGRKLKIFQGWNPEGEAHVTVITPPEFANILSRFLTMKDIEIIAQSEDIQKADLTVYGIGSGKKQIDGKEEETFFLIVDSMRLRSIRHKIWKSYVKKGGSQDDWDPTWFFPHVTIGFTKQDIHEPDIIKNIRSSHDKRFRLTLDKN